MSDLTPQTLAPVGVHTPMESRPQGCDLLLAMSAGAVKSRVQSIQQVMEAVMKSGVHYDVIPGTERKDKNGNDISKPTLLKPGAEVLCMTFGLTPKTTPLVTGDHPDIAYHWKDRKKEWYDKPGGGKGFNWVDEEGDTFGFFEVVTTCEIYGPDGRLLASASGSCNNREKKYRTLNVYEVRNTVMKMSAKRAFVAATLLATAASDCFSQDLEDSPEYNQSGGQSGSGSHLKANKGADKGSAKGGWLSDAQKRLVFAKGKKAGYDEAVVQEVQTTLDNMGKQRGKPYFDMVADEKPEAIPQVWDRAKAALESKKPAGAPEPPADSAPAGSEEDF